MAGQWGDSEEGNGVPRLESEAEAVGPYVWEWSSVVDLGEQRIRVAVPLQPKFYRLSVTGSELGPVRIESIRVENGEVLLD